MEPENTVHTAEELQALRARFHSVKAALIQACADAGRPADSVALLAAVKYADAGEINFLHRECGLCDIGENRVQTFLAHYGALEDKEHLRIHFIGTLQKNKVKYIVGKTDLIHSVDSAALAEEIDRQAAKQGIVQKVLIEINSGEEASKSGVSPAGAADLAQTVASLPHLQLCGFMTMGPKYGDEAACFANFSKTSQLALDIWSKKLHNIGIPLFSMGMTDSLSPAVRAGSGMVRVGRAIFGEKKTINEDK